MAKQPDQPNLPAKQRGGGGGPLGAIVDRAARVQAPVVGKYVSSLRQDHPDETPAQIIERLEKRYLLTVTGSGGAVGAAAAVPGLGTIAALGAVGAETVLFTEASALFALAVAEVHGIPIDDQELRKTLVLTVALGDTGLGALRSTVGAKNATLTNLKRGKGGLPGLGNLNQRLMKMFSRRFLAKRAPLLVGKILPAGIGAVVGAGGNRALGNGVINNAREAFGPPPTGWVTQPLRVVDGAVGDPGGASTGQPPTLPE